MEVTNDVIIIWNKILYKCTQFIYKTVSTYICYNYVAIYSSCFVVQYVTLVYLKSVLSLCEKNETNQNENKI